MPKIRSIRIDELSELAATHPEEIGKYDPKKNELRTPVGETIKIEAGKVGRSEKIYIKGKVREFLKGLDLHDLQPAAKEKAGGGESTSLSRIPSRQACSGRSWQAWFTRNYQDDPDRVCEAVRQGYAKAEDAIRQAREAEAAAIQQEAEAEARMMLKGLKGKVGAERLAELMKEV